MYNYLSVDFDDTLFVNGDFDYELINKLNKKQNGKVFVFTSRDWAQYPLLKWALTRAGLDFEGIVCGKLTAMGYIDDRNITL